MNVLFDTNVILDVMLDRTPFSESASQLFSIVEQGHIKGYICATTVTTIHYLASKVLGNVNARHHIKNLIALFDITSVNRVVIEDALDAGFSDFEDSVIYQSARHTGISAIVTRDPKGFKSAGLPVYSPIEMLRLFFNLPDQT
jgi:predicted nucleic acid-binding protein